MKKPYCLHPIFLAVFPILFLYTHNIYEAALSEIYFPLVITLGISLTFWLLFTLMLRSCYRGGLLISLLLLLFFSYGHIYQLIEGFNIKLGTWIIGENKILIAFWGLFSFLGIFFILKKKKNFYVLASILNVISGTLVAISLVLIVNYLIHSEMGNAQNEKEPQNFLVGSRDKSHSCPDIYYLILDGYASGNTLRHVFNYDNDGFYQFLKSNNFTVFNDSHSNYSTTYLSLASSLNMEYVNPLAEKVGKTAKTKKPLLKLIENNRVIEALKGQGYKYIHVSSSGFWMTKKNRHADWNLSCRWGGEFQTILIKSTLLNLWEDLLKNEYRERALTAFEKIPKIKEQIEGPRFIFAHFLIPHPPYVFGAEGEKVIQAGLHTEFHGWQYKEHYINQLKFTNKKVIQMVKEIMAAPDYHPIIILQGDHGPASTGEWDDPGPTMIRERMGILNAYLLPPKGLKLLYPQITPVNTFRLIMTSVFGINFPMLEDRIYFSNYNYIYNLIDVTDICKDSYN